MSLNLIQKMHLLEIGSSESLVDISQGADTGADDGMFSSSSCVWPDGLPSEGAGQDPGKVAIALANEGLRERSCH